MGMNKEINIPNGRTEVKLGEVCNINTNSLTNRTDENFSFYYVYLSMINDGVIEYSSNQILFKNSPSRARRIFKKNDILMSTVRPNLLGHAIIKSEVKNCICSTGFAVIEKKNGLFYNEYIYPNLFSYNIKKQIVSILVGSNYPAINSNDIKNLKILLPPPPVQKAIANILAKWDEAIKKTSKLIKAKKNKFRWFRNNVLKGRIRVGNDKLPWDLKLVKNILSEHGMTSTGKEEVYSVHKGIINQIEHLGRSFSAKNTDHYNLVKPRDIIYTKSPTGDFPYGIIKQSKLQEEVIVSPLYAVFTPETQELGAILDTYFESNVHTYNYLRPIIQKEAKNAISCNNKQFLSRKLFLPIDKKEERFLVKHISIVKKEIAFLEEILAKYKSQKNGLMQKLLTGKIRVNNINSIN